MARVLLTTWGGSWSPTWGAILFAVDRELCLSKIPFKPRPLVVTSRSHRPDRAIGERGTIVKTTIGLLMIFVLLGSNATFGGEGRKELFQPVVLSGAEANGKFFLSRDITATSGHAIEILGSGDEEVDIDLNGFKVEGTSTGNVIRVSNVRTLRLRNGTVISPSTTNETCGCFALRSSLTATPSSRT